MPVVVNARTQENAALRMFCVRIVFIVRRETEFSTIPLLSCFVPQIGKLGASTDFGDNPGT